MDYLLIITGLYIIFVGMMADIDAVWLDLFFFRFLPVALGLVPIIVGLKGLGAI